MDVAVGGDRDVRGSLHQRELGGRLDHPLGAHHRIGADDLYVGQLLPQPVEDEVAVRLLEADRRAPATPRSFRKSATSFSGSSSSCQTRTSAGIFRLSSTEGFSKKGVTMIGSPLDGNDRRRQPLRAPPLDAGEIVEARARLDDERADAVLLHQRAGLGNPLQPFLAADRRRDR